MLHAFAGPHIGEQSGPQLNKDDELRFDDLQPTTARLCFVMKLFLVVHSFLCHHVHFRSHIYRYINSSRAADLTLFLFL